MPSHFVKTVCFKKIGDKIVSTLFVCHSAGDNQVILETARKLLPKTKEAIYFLTVGKTAESSFKKLSEKDDSIKKNTYHLSEILQLNETDALTIDNDALSPKQLEQIQIFLNRLNITKALIGTPSQIKAAAPFQIAEYLANQLKVGLVYNDYLYKENAHLYWQILAEEKQWQTKYQWLLPLKTAKEELRKINTTVKSEIVGHPSIDTVINQTESNPNKEKILNSLQVSEKQTLLFISGTKNFEEDKALLNELLHTISKNNFSNIEIRLGIHPGSEKLQEYIQGLSNMIQQYANTSAANCTKFIITDALAKKIDLTKVDSTLLCRANVNGDEAADVAAGVACAVPATLLNKSAIKGVPAYYYQSDKKPYLPSDRLFVGKDNTASFFKKLSEKKSPITISKEKLSLPPENAADIMANKLNANILSNFLEQQLNYALAATRFIHEAKKTLEIPVYVPEIEKKIQLHAEESARKLGLDSEQLKIFVDHYCEVSKQIQNYWQEKEKQQTSNKVEYIFSATELDNLETIKKEIPELSSVTSLFDLQQCLAGKNGKEIAKSLLNWGRKLIGETNEIMYQTIKTALKEELLTQSEDINKQLSKIISNIFADKELHLELNEICAKWTHSLCECALQQESTYSFNSK